MNYKILAESKGLLSVYHIPQSENILQLVYIKQGL